MMGFLDDCVVLSTVSRLVEMLGGRELDDGTILEDRPIPLEYPYCRMGMLCSGVRVRSELMDSIIRTAIGDPKAIVLDLDYLRSEEPDTEAWVFKPKSKTTVSTTPHGLSDRRQHGKTHQNSPLLEMGLVFRKSDGNVWRSGLTLPNRVIAFENATSLDLLNPAFAMDDLEQIAIQTLRIQSQLMAALITNVTKFGVSSDETFKSKSVNQVGKRWGIWNPTATEVPAESVARGSTNHMGSRRPGRYAPPDQGWATTVSDRTRWIPYGMGSLGG